MTIPQDPNNTNFHIGQELYGYRIDNILPLPELSGVFYRLVHQTTGARHVHISTRDRENTFGVTFKTVPWDSTGVAHILEHTVLCGSKKFPVRDPFFSMLKRSLNTFMNAFTASDWTMYPFSTQNQKDFYNLMDVYLDAVFYPRLDETSFHQEGHRLEIVPDNNRTGKQGLAYQGVVFNEMKGAMSSADQVMSRSLLNALYPDTTYCHNSGGEPLEIPNLTHGQLLAFHQRHYHPSNAYFYTYGNLPLSEHLKRISEKVLRHFQAIDPETRVPNQPRWAAPKKARYTYPLATGEDPARKSQACLAWLMCDIQDTFEVLVLTVLEQILIGNAASPVRKALMDSGLGEALSDGSGYDADNKETLFACGLKNIDPASAAAVEKIILDTLQNLIGNGLDRDIIDSAIHQIEFRRKEITNTPYPFGIKLLIRMIGTWLHDGECERVLQLDNDFQRLRAEIDAGPFLEQRIQTYFLDNPHRVSFLLEPDPDKAKADEKQFQQRLDALWQKMSREEKERIDQEAQALKNLQETREDVTCLPTLALADIPADVLRYDANRVLPDLPLWSYTQPTSGILYFNTVSGVSALPQTLLPWVPFFCYAFPKIGTKKHDYTQIARRIDAVTGGLGLGAQARVLNGQPGSCLPIVALSAKCLNRNLSPMAGIAEELIADVDFSNHERLQQLLGEYHSGLETAIVQNGHRLAISLASRSFGPADALNEMWNGLHQVRTIRSFHEDLDGQKLSLLADHMTAIAKKIFEPDNVIMAAIGEADTIRSAESALATSPVFSAYKRNQRRMAFPMLDMPTDSQLPFEGWSTSTAVSFVAQTLPVVSFGHEDAPTLAVLSKMLRSLYLHREIREKGGAYGGLAVYNPEDGLLSLASYRDPHISRTLNVYAGVSRFVAAGEFSADDVKEAILQVCAEIDKPDPPGPAARKEFFRLITGVAPEDRKAYKQKVLTTTKEQILAVARRYFDPDASNAGVAVISNWEQLQKANTRLKDRPLQLEKI